jgi:hypothetical protein
MRSRSDGAIAHVTPKVRAFVDYFAKRCGGTPYWDKGLTFPGKPAASRRQRQPE